MGAIDNRVEYYEIANLILQPCLAWESLVREEEPLKLTRLSSNLLDPLHSC
jgi:hypothetical protein